ncbi:hypothetical protein SteCoe_1653 [Stentor coeruleus]|uniref:Uncharacterized protein n=1 Tax=Stentor coeruleus TaxID=5963 RepID=A0A1R2D1M8_9CILI|nr:hypothetical protein SteCoe_1653 [Stentor coeruleus]
MKFILDISDPKVQASIEELGIDPNQLLVKNIDDFEGPDKLKQLRYNHYLEKLEKISALVKGNINNGYNSPSRKVFMTSRPESNSVETVDKVRALHRRYLSIHIEEEAKKRDRMSKTMEKLSRKENLDKKIKEEIETKRRNDEQKREALEDRIKSLLKPKKPKGNRIHTQSPKVSEREHYVSKMSFNRNKSIDPDDIQIKLKSLDERLDRSKEIHQQALKEKTLKISWHTQKVDNIVHNHHDNKDKNIMNRVEQFVKKIHSVETRKEKTKSDFQDKIKKIQEKIFDRNYKIKQNQEQETFKEEQRKKFIEKKMTTTLQNAQMKTKEMQFERELKWEKAKLKGEDTLENAARLKKAELKRKIKILEKHQELDKKIEHMKEVKDKINEKKRDDMHKAVLEKLRLKDLKILVEKTEDTKKMRGILEKFYNSSGEIVKNDEVGKEGI